MRKRTRVDYDARETRRDAKCIDEDRLRNTLLQHLAGGKCTFMHEATEN
jgi:hypothetical protein